MLLTATGAARSDGAARDARHSNPEEARFCSGLHESHAISSRIRSSPPPKCCHGSLLSEAARQESSLDALPCRVRDQESYRSGRGWKRLSAPHEINEPFGFQE